MKNKKFLTIFASFLTVALVILIIPLETWEKHTPANTKAFEKFTIVIDPGHGGFDPGANINGVLEKEINLSIGLKLKEMFERNGFSVIMTRDEDVSTENGDSSQSKKKSDMRNRLALLNENPDNLFISIHQNRYSDSNVSGSQVFYGDKNIESANLAKSVQTTLQQELNQKKKKEEVKAKSNLFLLWNATVPSILVECGFLSNPTERDALQTESYQSQVAFGIFHGVLNYMNTTEEKRDKKDEVEIENTVYLQ